MTCNLTSFSTVFQSYQDYGGDSISVISGLWGEGTVFQSYQDYGGGGLTRAVIRQHSSPGKAFFHS